MESEEELGLLTIAQVAAKKGVGVSTVYNAINDGRLPSRRVLGRVTVTAADCESWNPTGHGGHRPGAGRRKEVGGDNNPE